MEQEFEKWVAFYFGPGGCPYPEDFKAAFFAGAKLQTKENT